MAPLLIEAHDLRRAYDSGAVQALRGVNFTIERGEFVSIMGPSGSGKSTLLNILGVLETEFDGNITIDGVNLHQLPEPERFRARVIGFVFQSFHLLPTLSAVENVQVPMFEMPWSASERRKRAAALLDSVGLAERMNHVPSRLSGGERQRVAIARSLANEPCLLLADEPTGNLDSTNADKILELLRVIHQRNNMTIIMVTHELNVAGQAQRILQMLDGRIVNDASSARKA